MKHVNLIALTISLFMGTELAHADIQIIRVGSGQLMDSSDGFTTPIPKQIQNVTETSTGVSLAQLTVPMGTPIPQWLAINVQPLADVYPGLTGVAQGDVLSYLNSQGGTWALQDSPNPCIVAATSMSGTTRIFLATWGADKGVVFTNPEDAVLDSTVQSLVGGLQLDDGACSW